MTTAAIEIKLSRRKLVLGAGAASLALVAPCQYAAAAENSLKLGFVSPRTGPLAGFGETDGYVLDQARKALANGLQLGGKTFAVEILDRDTQSDPSRAGQLAKDLIDNQQIDLMLAVSTPETINPVADACEAAGVPCLSTVMPWEAWYFGRGAKPGQPSPFKWTYHFGFGVDEFYRTYVSQWALIDTNKKVGVMYPNDADGNAWGDPQRGLPPALAKAGYKLTDPGRYQLMNNDFTSQISAFKAVNAEIVTGNMIPPDFATFWSQAAQQGFKPKIVTIGKALLFPSVIDSLGARGNGLTSEIWWTPNHPFKSGLTGQSAKELTDAYVGATKRPWTQPIGFQHALFEVAIDVLKRTKTLEPKAILDAIVATDYKSIVGPVKWTGQPVKNVTKTPLVAGQWQRSGDKFDLVITTNKTAPEIPVGGPLQVLS
jgi:branched-chain amino acid transport system substrate-binding protein